MKRWKLFEIFKNQSGLSMVEVVVASALMMTGVVVSMKMSQESGKQSQTVVKNFEAQDYIESLRSYLGNKTNCDSVITFSSGSLNFNLLGTGITPPVNTEVEESRIIAPETSAGVEYLSTDILVRLRYNSQGKEMKLVKKLAVHLEFLDGVFQGCVNHEMVAHASVFKNMCENLGGVYNEVSAADDECDFSGMENDALILVETRKTLCRQMLNGNYNSSTDKCESMDLDTTIYASNLTTNSFRFDGKTLNGFDEICSGVNNFFVGFDSSGGISCRKVEFCTKGEPQCP